MNCLDEILNYVDREQPVPGLVISIYENEKSKTLAWGHYSSPISKPVQQDTVYDLASITKLYTAYLIIELHQMRILSIYDDCSKFLPTFTGSSLRVIDLLTHRASFNLSLKELRLTDDFQRKIFNVKPPLTSSKEVNYENLTFLFLGKLLEKLYQKDLTVIFYDFFKKYNLGETFLGNVGHTYFDAPPTEIIDGAEIKNVTHDESSRMLGGIAGNAGVFSSAGDLIKFGSIWLNNSEIGQLAFKNYSGKGELPQGLGWWNRVQGYQQATPDVFCHTGYTGGILAVNPKRRIIVSMVTNRTLFGRENNRHRVIWQILADFIK